MEIPFTTGAYNIKWQAIMADTRALIRDNPDEFFENGGWDFLQEEKDDNRDEEEDDKLPNGDSDFSVEESELVNHLLFEKR